MTFKDIEHIVIRDPSYVAGSNKEPEVGVFVQTRKTSSAINENKLQVGQKVWMKWTGGPIVAQSELLSWHTGKFDNGNINAIRDRCIGTKLFGLNNYWESVSAKTSGFFAVILLTGEKWIDPVYPKSRSQGSSWIYLDTAEKREQWLRNDSEKQMKDNNPSGRAIPKSLRFLILKRDEFTCQYCGRQAPTVELHIDHIIPWKIEKKHREENLIAACADCNIGKSDKFL